MSSPQTLNPVPVSASLYIPSTEQRKLEIAYYPNEPGRKCCLTKSVLSVQLCHIIPHHDAKNRRTLLHFLRENQLVPPDMTHTSSINIIPLASNLYYVFDQFLWTFYPTVDVLKTRIAFEELQLRHREAAVHEGRDDPGRPLYNNSYANFPRTNTFDVIFAEQYPEDNLTSQDPLGIYSTRPSDNQPQFPSRDLDASVEIMIRARTSILLAPPMTANDATYKQFHFGTYLMTLWAATPSNFRQRTRPHNLPFALPPPSESSTLPPLSYDSAVAIAAQLEPPASITGSPPTMTESGEPLTPPASPKESPLVVEQIHPADEGASILTSDDCNIPKDRTPLKEMLATTSNEPEVTKINEKDEVLAMYPKEPGIMGGYTSTEWAFLLYNCELGGPKWHVP